MIVCICNKVNSAQIRAALREGATDLQDVADRLGLGTGCGGCVEYAERMIAEEIRTLSGESEAA